MTYDALLEVRDLCKHFPIHRGILQRQVGSVKAVDGISFDIKRGETLGLVGESGCGKSTAGRTILRLYDATSGSIQFDGTDVATLHGENLRSTRPRMQMIFQDPQACLNPRMNVGSIIAEPLNEHRSMGRKEKQEKVRELLNAVGLNPDFTNRYPHEFSGGQRQRIGIARALALNPKMIVLDEPVSALDVSVQAQVVNLLEDLQEERGLSYLFIAHDLSVVRHISDRVAVMYLGRIVEIADSESIYQEAAHPYTASLLSAVPVADPNAERTRQRIVLEGDLPSPANVPSGCRFRTRCPIADGDRCTNEDPQLADIGNGHMVACHYPIAAGETLVELTTKKQAAL